MQKLPSLPTTLMILIALAQGLALLLLHQSLEMEFWPYQQPQWLLSFYAVAVAIPTLLLLGLSHANQRQLFLQLAGFAAIVAPLGYYSGYQLLPIEHIRIDNVIAGFVITLSLASFLVLVYQQSYQKEFQFSYQALFDVSWRNLLTFAFALLFTLVFWGILMLWAGLFKAINIDFFFDLFTERWFFYPILALANGLGVIIFRRLAHIIDTIVRLLHALLNVLLVVLVFVALIFLLALPFSGLQPLWDSGGSALILAMQWIMLFFVNAVYQAEKYDRPYPLWIHRFVTLGLLTLPVYSAISFYGLTLRIEQYGWTVARCWALLLWLVLALFALGYLVQIVMRRLNWFGGLATTNTALGLAVLSLLLAVNSPLLDFRKISVHSQLQRLREASTDIGEFDISYFRRALARPGYLALQQLKEDYPELARDIDSLYRDRREAFNFESFQLRLNLLSEDIPEEVQRYAQQEIVRTWYTDDNTEHYFLITTDADQDKQADYLFILQQEKAIRFSIIYREQEQWQHLPTAIALSSDDETELQAFIDSLQQQAPTYVSPRWRDIEIGNVRLKPGS